MHSEQTLNGRLCCCREGGEAAPAALNGLPDSAQQQPLLSETEALPPPAEAPTGWAEQGMQIDEQGEIAQQDDMVAAKFKPGIKFKLGV